MTERKPELERTSLKEVNTRVSPVTNSKLGAERIQESVASYFGILVKVIVRMEHCSLIRYHDREVVVGTEDLQLCRATQRVA